MKTVRVFTWGIAAGAVAVGASFLVRILLGGTYLPELASATLFSLVPGSVESSAVENLGSLAKESAYVGASALNVVVLGLIPVVIQRFARVPEDRVRAAIIFAVSPYAVMLALGLLFLSLAQVSSQSGGLTSLAASLLLPSVVFGTITGFSLYTPLPETTAIITAPKEKMKTEFSKKRRLFIKSAVAASVGAVLLYYGVGLLVSKRGPQATTVEEAGKLPSAQVTANDQFYRVDVNVIPPSVDSNAWSLKLHGMVTSPTTISYSQLLSLPSVEEHATLECVSNKVGGDLMSTALWRGVKLKGILDAAVVAPDADYLIFKCVDGYDVGIPLDRAVVDGTILAYEMNGAKLPVEHGFPVRAIVPGLYGMMNAKWITDIEVARGTYEGFWQRRGWTNTAAYQTGSTILTPGDSQLRDRFPLSSSLTDVAGNPVAVAGVAFTGDRGVQKVEVSTDGGKTWQPASVDDPLSKYTWLFWRLEWNPPASGGYRLMVRATDGQGNLQTATMTDPFPNGATGYQVVDVSVATS